MERFIDIWCFFSSENIDHKYTVRSVLLSLILLVILL